MCGLIVVLSRDGASQVAMSSLLAGISHRGPDDDGWLTWSHGRIARGKAAKTLSGQMLMGHRRLSIIDLTASGWQPMSSQDQRYHLVFNGELYNYIEIRRELQSEGVQFVSQSDTEVVIEAFRKWGTQAFQRFTGMFAFAIFDALKGTVTLVRDPFGIKPLYYCEWENGLAFSSEIPPLLTLRGVSRAIDPQHAYDYLQFGITDHSPGTLFRDVKQLRAAEHAVVDVNNIAPPQCKAYWAATSIARNDDISFEEAQGQLRDRFLENISLHMRSDVPVGIALSGGLDSSAIACAARFLNPKAEIQAFSYISPDAAISEEKWIDIVGDAARLRVNKIVPSSEDLSSDLASLIRIQGEPFGSTSIYAQYRVFKLAHESGIKVLLDGQGADELFGGYVGYQGSRLASLIKRRSYGAAWAFLNSSSRMPGRNKVQLLKYAARHFLTGKAEATGRYLSGKTLIPKWMNTAWFAERNVRFEHPIRLNTDRDCLRDILKLSVSGFSLPHLLRYEDRNSMAFSLESRVPFLTTDMAEFVLSLPEEYLISENGRSKHVLRAALGGIVPEVILGRNDKIGFSTPERLWLSDLAPFVGSEIAAAGDLPLFNASRLIDDWEKTLEGKHAFDYRFWRWVNFSIWASTYAVTF